MVAALVLQFTVLHKIKHRHRDEALYPLRGKRLRAYIISTVVPAIPAIFFFWGGGGGVACTDGGCSWTSGIATSEPDSFIPNVGQVKRYSRRLYHVLQYMFHRLCFFRS